MNALITRTSFTSGDESGAALENMNRMVERSYLSIAEKSTAMSMIVSRNATVSRLQQQARTHTGVTGDGQHDRRDNQRDCNAILLHVHTELNRVEAGHDHERGSVYDSIENADYHSYYDSRKCDDRQYAEYIELGEDIWNSVKDTHHRYERKAETSEFGLLAQTR